MKKRYIKEIIGIIRQIDNPTVLMKILTVAKPHLAILNGDYKWTAKIKSGGIFMDFKDVVKMIEESNRKVDEVLKAAKLQRHERAPMPKDKLELILNYIVGILALLLGATAVFMFMYFMFTS